MQNSTSMITEKIADKIVELYFAHELSTMRNIELKKHKIEIPPSTYKHTAIKESYKGLKTRFSFQNNGISKGIQCKLNKLHNYECKKNQHIQILSQNEVLRGPLVIIKILFLIMSPVEYSL